MKSFLVRLVNRYGSYNDINCPKCGKGQYIEWTTEYSDPMDGEFVVECDLCGYEFTLRCNITIGYDAIDSMKNEDADDYIS